MAKDPAFSFYAQDYLVDTFQWDRGSKSLHVDLLAISWINGFIEADNQGVPLNISEEDKQLWHARVKYKWELRDGKLYNARLEDGREKRKKFLEGQSEKGKKSAEKRVKKVKKSTKKQPLSNHGSTVVEPQLNHLKTENEKEKEIEEVKETSFGKSENLLPEPIPVPPDPKVEYAQLEKKKETIWEFVKVRKPDFIEPYVDLWNIFAEQKGMSKVTEISEKRRRKFKVRINEPAFNFLAVLKKAGQSEFLQTGKWFGFDWIIKNDENYLKVIEGNYDKKPEPEQKPVQTKERKPAEKTFGDVISYLFGRFQEGQLDENLILPEYYDTLVIRTVIPAGTSDKMPGATIEEKKVNAVVELFKQKANVDQKAPAAAGQ